MMRYSVIGTGWITRAFIDAVRLTGKAEFYGVYSRSKEKGEAFCRENGGSVAYASLEELARCEKTDAVYIASPNSLHFSQTRLMLENGKHVICEKPAAVTPDEIVALQDFAEKNGLIYMEAITYLHAPGLAPLRKALGSIGRISSAHLDFTQLSSKYPAYLRGEAPNIFNPAFATGSLMDLGVYCVYPALDLFGIPERVTASARFLESGSDESGAAVFEYPDKLVTLTWSKTGQSFSPSQIVGDGGTLTIDSLSQLTGIRRSVKGGETESVFGECEREKVMSGEASDFFDCIADPVGNREAYERCRELSLDVSRVMLRIRRTAGISFQS